MDWNIVTNVLSLIAILCTAMVAIFQMKQAASINVLNLENEYFRKAFAEYLIDRIPKARSRIRITKNGTLSGKDELKDELKQLMLDALYYRYNDYAFYDNFCSKIQALEDFLVQTVICEDKEYVEGVIDAYIEEIYECANNKYKGI